jgi:uncharacterized protein
VLDKLAAEARSLRIERDALKGSHDRHASLSEAVRRTVLDLIGAANLGEVLAVAKGAAPGFGAEACAFCVEAGGLDPSRHEGLRQVPPGTVNAVVGPEGMGAILSGGGALLLGEDGVHCNSVAAFRLHLGDQPALYVLGAAAPGSFEGRAIESDLRFFAQALERAIRLWRNPATP